MKKDCCIVIPIYKEELSIIDRVSLDSLFDTCREKHDIAFICPSDLNIEAYKMLYSYNKKVTFIKFNPDCFKDTKTYSLMLENYDFYKTFDSYEYILIYQTDCYMIKDNISEWCSKGYDYVGAPIVSNKAVWKTAPTVGNGGLSLRKVSAFMEMTNPDNIVLKIAKKFVPADDAYVEDHYFCESIYPAFEFSRPSVNEAALFAIDMNPNYVIKSEFPMGLHAYDKNIMFWKMFIPELDNIELVSYCKEKYANGPWRSYFNQFK